MVTRAIFVLLSALAGMALFLRAQDPSREFLLMGLGMGTVAGGLILATVYGRFHYAVDALAGMALAATMVTLAQAVQRRVTSASPQLEANRSKTAGSRGRCETRFPAPYRLYCCP